MIEQETERLQVLLGPPHSVVEWEKGRPQVLLGTFFSVANFKLLFQLADIVCLFLLQWMFPQFFPSHMPLATFLAHEKIQNKKIDL